MNIQPNPNPVKPPANSDVNPPAKPTQPTQPPQLTPEEQRISGVGRRAMGGGCPACGLG